MAEGLASDDQPKDDLLMTPIFFLTAFLPEPCCRRPPSLPSPLQEGATAVSAKAVALQHLAQQCEALGVPQPDLGQQVCSSPGGGMGQ